MAGGAKLLPRTNDLNDLMGRRNRSRLARAVGNAMLGVGALLLGVLVAVLCIAARPPAELLRRAALPIAARVLKHKALRVGYIDIVPWRRVELRDIWLGPPAGYRLPMLTVRRILVEYDLSRIGDGRVAVRQVRVEQPIVRVEQVRGKLNWIAFLEGLPPSAPEEPPSEPSEMTIELGEAAVVGFAAYVDDGVHRAVLDGLDITASGRYGPKDGKLAAAVTLGARGGKEPNLALRISAPQDVEAKARVGLRIGVQVHRIVPPKVDVDLALEVAAREVRAPQPLAPATLGLKLRAGFDQDANRAELRGLALSLDGAPLLDLRATVEQVLGGKSQLDALLSRLHLPLDRLAPYARAFVPGLEVGGAIEAEALRLVGRLDRPAQPSHASGSLRLQGVRARLAARDPRGREAVTRVDDVNAAFTFAARAERTPGSAPRHSTQVLAGLPVLERGRVGALPDRRPAVSVHGHLRVGGAAAAGAQLSDLAVALAAGLERGADGNPERGVVAARLRVDLGRARYVQPGLGTLQGSAGVRLQVRGDLGQGDVSLDHLELALDRLLRAKVSATLRRRKDFELQLAVEPVDLAAALARLPPKLRAQVADLELKGGLGLDVRAKGRLPAFEADAAWRRTLERSGPLALVRGFVAAERGPLPPLELGLALALQRLGVHQKKSDLRIHGLDGTLQLAVRQGQAAVDGALQVLALRTPEATAAAIKVPLTLRLDPQRLKVDLGLRASSVAAAGAAVRELDVMTTIALSPSAALFDIPKAVAVPLESTVSVKAAKVTERGAGLTLQQLKLSAALHTVLPLSRLAGGQPFAFPAARVELALATAKGLVHAAGIKATLAGLSAGVQVRHEPGRPHPVVFDVQTGLSRVEHRQLGVVARGLALTLGGAAGGVPDRMPMAPLVREALYTAPVRLRAQVASLTQRGDMAPLREVSAAVDVRLGKGGRVALQRVALRVPSHRLRADIDGSAEELFAGHAVPPFDVRLRAALEAPRASTRQRALLLVPGVRVAGKVGLVLRVRRPAARRIRVDGRLVADRFNLWQLTTGTERGADRRGYLRKESVLTVRGFSADVPLAQEVELTDGPLPVQLPAPRRSIFTEGARTALYSALRPYGGKRGRLSLDGVALEDRITALTEAGHFINTRTRRLGVGKIALDLSIADSTVALERLYVQLFGGDLAGALALQLSSLQPLDAGVKLNLQITGVDLKHLDPAGTGRGKDEIAALVDLRYELASRKIGGRVEITRLSLKQLDGLLAFLDPNQVNQSVRKNRELLGAFYMRLAEIKLVSIWIEHGNLNMDIDIALPTVLAWMRPYLRWTLKQNRIRRLNIVPLLPKF